MAIEDNREIRRTLQNLLPGSTYATRVRAVSELGQYSDWSEALEFTAAGGSSSASYTLVAPPAPTVQAQLNSLQIIMNYTAVNDGISLYILEHSSDNVSFSEINRGQIPLYIHTVPPGVTHYYRFSVVDIYGNQSPVSPANSGAAISSISHKPFASVVVAAHNSLAAGKENADFICDGVDDHITLNAAAASISAWDGRVILLEGEYNLAGRVDTYAATWEGQGLWATYLYVEADITGDLISGESFRGLYIDGNGHSVTGYAVESYTNIEDCYIYNFSATTTLSYVGGSCTGSFIETGGTGIIIGSGARVTNSYVANCSETGMEINSEGLITNSYFEDCMIGVTFNAPGSVTGSSFEGCTRGVLTQSDEVAIVGNRFSQTTSGTTAWVAIEDYGDTIISGNRFEHCGVKVWGMGNVSSNFFYLQAAHRAFWAESSSSAVFMVNVVNHASYAGSPGIPPIRIENSVTGALISGNSITVYAPTGAYSDAGISTNYGAGNYVNKVWIIPSTYSTAADKNYVHDQASGATTWTIDHNLAKRPAVVTIDTSNKVIYGVVEYISDNQVTVTFNVATSGKAYCN